MRPPHRPPSCRHRELTLNYFPAVTSSGESVRQGLEALLSSGSAVELKAFLERAEASCPPKCQAYLRDAATRAAAAGNMEAVMYICGGRVAVHFVPPDETSESSGGLGLHTPLMMAFYHGHDDIVMRLLALPRGEDSPPLNVCRRDYPILTLAAERGKKRVVEALLNINVDLMTWDEEGHLAVCRAVTNCDVEVVNMLLEAHARQDGSDEGVRAILDGPCWQEERGHPLLIHAINDELDIADEARVAMVRCLSEKWGASVRVLGRDMDAYEFYSLYIAAATTNLSVVAYFLDECGV